MRKALSRLGLGLLILTLLIAVGLWLALRASLPTLDGVRALPALSASVSVERDALGVATLEAASERDAMAALGYVHAQERFFEMDLLRRSSAGELAALVGPPAVNFDRDRRRHRMRARVLAQIDSLPADQRALIAQYTAGVNAGLTALRARPWPYLLLRQTPHPWTEADTLLAGFAMYFDLQDADADRDRALLHVLEALPPPLQALISHRGSSWDAPLIGGAIGDATLPDADAIDLRSLPQSETPWPLVAPDRPFSGSNNFAVGGALTADGRAIVANDMHLGLRAPALWFRARLRYPQSDAPDGQVDVAGFTLPGVPAVIVGSNGHVAWGFTNSYVDTVDLKRLTPCSDPGRPDGCDPVTVHKERIDVAGADPVDIDVEDSDWGPIFEREPDGRLLAVRWVGHLPGALNFGLAGMSHAGNLDQALAVADRSAQPTQNLLAVDREGHIAWRWLGALAQRGPGCDPLELVAADGCAPWGIASDTAPALIDPPNSRLWTANTRVADIAMTATGGDGGFDLGARAGQIRDGLQALTRVDEPAMLQIMLDDRALFLARWHALLQETAARTGTPALQDLARAAQHWEGRASVDSVSYRLVRAWRLSVLSRISDNLTAPAQLALGDRFEMPRLSQVEGVAWPLLQQRPAHLLSRHYASWDALLEQAAEEVRTPLLAIGPLAERRWGERNTARICHPLAAAIPMLGARLCMPGDPLPGDNNMPRVAAPAFGASERMVVSPGHEADGIIELPGGQSGHPLSPFWGAGHADWVAGRATPFLAGETEYRLVLQPGP